VTEIAPSELAPAAPPGSDLGARIVHGFLASIALLCLVTLGWRGVWKLDGAVLADLVARHGPAVIGVPVAVAMATSVVGGFRAIDGKLRVRLLGVEADGAGAAVICWIIVFLGVVLSIRALW
jgi:hypothetical protein